MTDQTLLASLRPADIMLFRPVGIFGRIIQVKTWHNISHVELYDGNGQSIASRDGIGVDRYPVRLTQLAYVLRPQVHLDLSKIHAYFDTMKGTPYGWLELLCFVGPNVQFGSGIVCSPFVAGCLRAGGWNVFPTDPINKVTPFQFLDLLGDDCEALYGPDPLG